MLENQGRLFYKTSGSVTKAIRVFVDGLNKYFTQQNSHYDQPETWTTASLSLGVIHYDTLFIAQVGQSSAHILRSDGDELFFDSELNRPGLGAVTVVNPRYFQTSLKGDESFLLLPDPQAFPPTESPLEEQLQQGSPAAFIQGKPGSGRLTILGLDQYQPKPSEPLQDDANESEKDEPEVTVELQAEKTAEAETTAYTPSLAEDLFTQAVLLPDETPVAALKKSSTTQPTYPVGELSILAKALIAILVPLVLIAITSMVYFSRGEEHEYNYYLAQAQASVNNAALMQTVALQREGWEQASNWLNQAAAYQNSAEVKSLRVQIQTALDALDGVRRLQFAPGFAASLYPGWDITAIVSLNNDLYLLDQASGAVMYMRLRNTGYELDDQFKCGAGKYGGVEVGKLVDMISVPLNNPAKAPILAIDASGKLLYCSPGGTASAVALPVPDGGWAELKRMVFDSNKLYILDTGNYALWSYRGLTANFSNPPTAFFDDPKIELATAVDLAVEGEELFLLHADGHSSHCLSSSITGMISCDEPYPYHNTEGGNPDFESTDLHFDRLAYSPPPDPSVYYLEAKQAALYQFSLRLNLNKVLRFSTTDGSMPGQKVTAFYVSPDRRVFLAFGNQLYHAVLP